LKGSRPTCHLFRGRARAADSAAWCRYDSSKDWLGFVGIELRGSSSLRNKKKSYSIKLRTEEGASTKAAVLGKAPSTKGGRLGCWAPACVLRSAQAHPMATAWCAPTPNALGAPRRDQGQGGSLRGCSRCRALGGRQRQRGAGRGAPAGRHARKAITAGAAPGPTCDRSYVPEFVQEGWTYRTAEAGGLSLYLWEGLMKGGAWGSEEAAARGEALVPLGLLTASVLATAAEGGRSVLPLAVAAALLPLASLAAAAAFAAKRVDVEEHAGRLHVQVGAPTERALRAASPPTLQVEVRDTMDGRGRGAYAAATIPAYTYLGDYEGELMTAREFRSRNNGVSDYTHFIDEEWVIDGTALAQELQGDTARFSTIFMNHSSANSNAVRRNKSSGRAVSFYTCREVAAGEELLYDYGSRYWAGREHLLIQ